MNLRSATWNWRCASSRAPARSAGFRAKRKPYWWPRPAEAFSKHQARPGGRARWTLDPLADEMVRLAEHDGISRDLDAHRSWRKVKVTDSRTAVDFAACMRELTDVDFPQAERIRVVMDNLSTHTAGALYQAFPACEAQPAYAKPSAS